jgi:tetratricopeptide (TPR) repeat protein
MDDPGQPSRFRPFRMLLDRSNRRGNLFLAESILDSLQQIVDPDTLEAGRLQYHRGSVSIRRGLRDAALAEFRALARMGRRLRQPELLARAYHGASMAMWMGGNLPAATRLAKRAMKLAGTRFEQIHAIAKSTLATTAALRGDFEESLALSWESLQVTVHDQFSANTNLANIAQALMDAGYPSEARAVFQQMLGTTERAPLLATLGGFALASAALGDAAAVNWAVENAVRIAKAPGLPRETADSLLECAHALDEIGKHAKAATIRARALATARRYGFHEIEYLAERNIRRGVPKVPKKITKASEAIVSEIAEQFEFSGMPLIGANAE